LLRKNKYSEKLKVEMDKRLNNEKRKWASDIKFFYNALRVNMDEIK
jgi:hypothetical protein